MAMDAQLLAGARAANPALNRLLSLEGLPEDMPPILCHSRSATQLMAVSRALQRHFYDSTLEPPCDTSSDVVPFASNNRFMCLRAGAPRFIEELYRLTGTRDVCGHMHQLVLLDLQALSGRQQRQLCNVLDRSAGQCNFLMFVTTLGALHAGLRSRCCCVNANGRGAREGEEGSGTPVALAFPVVAQDRRSRDPVAASLLLSHASNHPGAPLPADSIKLLVRQIDKDFDKPMPTSIRRVARGVVASRTPYAVVAPLLLDLASEWCGGRTPDRRVLDIVLAEPPPRTNGGVGSARLVYMHLEMVLWELHAWRTEKKHISM